MRENLMAKQKISREVALAAAQHIKERDYWLGKLAGDLKKSAFPQDNSNLSFSHATLKEFTFYWDSELFSGLIELSKGNDHTLHVILLTGLTILLYKYTGNIDIIVGTPIYRQSTPGELTNKLLAIRNRLEPGVTFKELLIQVKQSILEALANQAYPLELVPEILEIPKSNEEFPLFSTAILLDNIQNREYLDHISLRTVFKCHRAENSIEINIEYNNSTYSLSLCKQIAKQFTFLMKRLLQSLNESISIVDILSKEEKKQLLVEFNNTKVNYPGDKNIQQLFETQRGKFPHRIALAAIQQPHKEQKDDHEKYVITDISYLTYKKLDNLSNHLAWTLIAKGCNPDTIIAIMVKRSLEMTIGILGILKAGGAYLPISPTYPKERISFILADSKTRFLLKNSDTSPNTKNLKIKLKSDEKNQNESPIKNGFVLNLDELKIEPETKPNKHATNLTPFDLAYIIYTSGSTGWPKGVMVSHQNVIRLVQKPNYIEFKPGDRILQTGALEFDASTFEIWGALLNGLSIYLVPQEMLIHPEIFKNIIIYNCITTLWLTSPLFNNMAQERVEIFCGLKNLLVGGDVLSPYHINKVKQRYPHLKIINGYGPTENTTFSTTFLIEQAFKENIPIGKPIANSTAYIVDRDNNLLPVWVPGELLLGGDGVARGYMNRPELTTERFMRMTFSPGRLYRSGDLACWLPDGNIRFLGRIDQQVKIRGFRIELREIENTLLLYPNVKEVFVTTIEKQEGDKDLAAYIVIHSSLYTGSIQIEELRRFLGERLPDYMIPGFFILLDKLPLTINGKINRKALPSPGNNTGDNISLPQNEIETKLAELFSEILGIALEKIGREAHFFKAGGHSLKATQLIAKIHKRFGVIITLINIFKHPTLKELALYIIEKKEDRYISIDAVEAKEYYILSPAQKRIYLLNQLESESTNYNIPIAYLLPKELNSNCLEHAIRELIRRHESFRTSFHMVSGEPVQRIHQEIEFEVKHYSPVAGDIKNLITKVFERFVQPFDLTIPPLMRIGLVKTESGKSILFVDMHHIITDGLSMELFRKELQILYTKEEIALQKIQYKDYAQWLQKDEIREKVKVQENFWLKEFAGEIPVLNLPIDYPRPALQSFEGNKISFDLGNELTAGLKRLADDKKVTLFMLLLAGFKIMLMKISGQEDIIVGTPLAGRRHAQLGGIIGMFVNTLALRSFPAFWKDFSTFLEELKIKILKTFEIQEYPFEELVVKLALDRDVSRNPLFDVMLVLQNLEGEKPPPKNIITESYEYQTITSKFDLTLIISETDNQLNLTWEYCSKLLKEETILRYNKYFKRIIRSILHDHKICLSDISILSKEDKKQILVDFNNTNREYPRKKNLQELFLKQVEKKSNQISLLELTPTTSEIKKNGEIACCSHISYRELNERTNRLAQLLIRRGVEPDTPVGIMVNRSILMIIGVLSIIKAGGAYLPINIDYPVERKRHMLIDSGAKILILSQENKAMGEQITANIEKDSIEIIDISGELSSIGSIKNNFCDSNSLAYIIYTSGSTGKPKGVMVTHRNVIRLIQNTNFIEFKTGDSILQTGALEFDASTFEIWGAILNGILLCLTSKDYLLDSNILKAIIINNRISTIWMTAPWFNRMVREDLEIFAGLKKLLVGGDILSPMHINKVIKQFPQLEIINGYGPTENTTFSTTFLIDKQYINNIPIGKPIANSTSYIVDKKNNTQPIGVAGELLVGGDGVTRGYLNNPELTAKKFVNRKKVVKNIKKFCPNLSTQLHNHSILYRTGDLACWLIDGNIRFLGRFDQQVKIRGFRIELEEIEKQLLKHNMVKEVVVVVKKDEAGDKYICAYINSEGLEKKTGEIEIPGYTELRTHLSKFLPEYMIPNYFIGISEIPLTANGKVDYRALPEPEFSASQVEYIPPENQTQKQLLEIWSSVLEIDSKKIGIDNNFFQMGGHSLRGTVIAAKIHRQFNLRVLLSDIFKNPTIRQLSRFIGNSVQDRFISIEPVELREYYSLSSAQKRLFALNQVEGGTIHYNIPEVFTIREEPELEQLEWAIGQLIKRHESFRTSFHIINDEAVQRVHPEVAFQLEIDDFSRGEKKPLSRSSVRNTDSIKNFVQPFDFSHAPLLRVGLVKDEDGTFILMVDMHHIISDGISMGIFNKELQEIYDAGQLPVLELQYKDYALWQQKDAIRERINAQEGFWLNEYEGDLPILDLPLDYSRPLRQSFAGNTISFNLGKEIAVKLKHMTDKLKVTLFMFLLANFNVLLMKLSGQEDIIVGTPVAGRRHAQLEGVIGMFVNTLALRNYPDGNKTFTKFLAEIKTRTLEAFENQEYPFEELVNRLMLNRDQSRNPVFDVMLSVQNIELENNYQKGLFLEPYEYQNYTAKFDLTLFIAEKDNDLLFSWEYCTQLFTERSIHRLNDYFKQLIRSILENPHLEINDINLLTKEEKSRILFDFNRLYKDYQKNKSLPELFREQVGKFPDHVALVGKRQEYEESHRMVPLLYSFFISYAELNKQASQLAHLLIQKGFGFGTIVSILMDRSIETIIAILAVLKSGATYLPINPQDPKIRIEYLLNDSKVKAIISTSTLFAKIMKSKMPDIENNVETIFIDTMNLSSENPPELSFFHSSQPAYIIFTSGSTGKPKGVIVEHRSVINLLFSLKEAYSFVPEDAFLLKTSFSFDVSVVELFGWYLGGGRLVILEKGGEKDPQIITESIVLGRITHINFVPSMFNAFMGHLNFQSAQQLLSLKYIFLAGEALSRETVKHFRRLNTSIQLENLYGPTEATVYASMYSLSGWGGDLSVPIGKPLANVNLIIVSQKGRLTAIGEPGELCIGGDGVARGYLNRPELTAEKFIQCRILSDVYRLIRQSILTHSTFNLSIGSVLYRSGDMARWLENGDILFLGRLDQQVKVRGYRIELGEIENQLVKHEKIRNAAVVLNKDRTGDEYLCAYYITSNEVVIKSKKLENSYRTELKDYLSKTLPDYMIPAHFIEIPEIPVTVSGKVDRNALPAPGDAVDIVGYSPPQNITQQMLLEIWSSVLAIDKEKIGVDDNFFRLGGHSLKGTVITAKIHQQFNTRVALTEIFSNPTIRKLSRFIAQSSKNPFYSIDAVELKEYYTLSSAQMRLFILNQVMKDNVHYNMPQIYYLEKEPDMKRLDHALKQLILRHESFRTSFQVIENEPVQRVQSYVEFEIDRIQPRDNDGEVKTGEITEELTLEMINNFISPFDLSKAPLIRVGLFKAADNRFGLIVDMHHIISDGISLKIFKKEMFDFYEMKQFPLLRLQYKDYAEWQRREIQREKTKQQENFWLKEFSDEIPVLDLPLDFTRPSIQSFSGNTTYSSLEKKIVASLSQFINRQQVTIYMFLLAAFNILLGKLTRQEDIIVGTPVAGRRHVQIDKIIGMFVNTLAIRTFPQGQESFLDFLKQVKKKTLETFENQEYPFEELVEHLEIERDSGRNPLFDVMFSAENREPEAENLHSLSRETKDLQTDTAKFDLILATLSGEENLDFAWQYCTHLFREETVRFYDIYFRRLIAKILDNPLVKINEISIINEEEKKQVLVDFNKAAGDCFIGQSIQQLFTRQVEKAPDHIVLAGQSLIQVNKRKTDNLSSLFFMSYISYKELKENSHRLAQFLIAKGVQSDTITGVMVERSIEMAVAVLGILEAGGAYLPIAPDYPEERKKHMVVDSRIKILISDRKHSAQKDMPVPSLKVIHPVHYQTGESRMVKSKNGNRIGKCKSPEDSLAYIIYTSGSTGRPKGVMVTHRNVIRLVKDTAYVEFNPGDRLLQTGALEFDASTFEIWGTLLNRLSLYLMPKEQLINSVILKEILHKNRINMMWMTAPWFNRVTQDDVEIFAELDCLLVGGDVLSPHHIDKVKNRLPELKIINGYGPTENTTFSTTFLIEQENRDNIPIGKPITNSTAYIVDNNDILLPIGIAGELLVGGRGVARGYMNNPELTSEKFFRPQFFAQLPGGASRRNKRFPSIVYRTGDLTSWQSDGNIRFLGRKDQQVKIRGNRIELGEIENRLCKHERIKEAVVIQKEDNTGDKYLCAYITLEDGREAVQNEIPQTGELREYLLKGLPDFMIPTHFIRIPQIPLTPNGKIDRKALPEPEISEDKILSPTLENNIQVKLLEIWSFVLKVDNEKIGIESNFFHLGGHSLKATQLISKIHKTMGINISLGEVFNHPTIREMAQFISDSSKKLYKRVKPVEKKEFYPVSAIQKRFYLVDQMEGIGLAYNLAQVFAIEGNLSLEKLCRAFQLLIQRHESLRTSFKIVEGQIVQIIHDDVEFEIEHFMTSEDFIDKEESQVPSPENAIKSFIRPFDLAKAPLIRGGLVEIPSQEKLLMLDIHHIVSDGTSQGILFGDLLAFYDGQRLPALSIHYKDFSQWQASPEQSAEIEKQGQFWQQLFEKELPETDIFTDYPRPAVQSFKGGVIEFHLGPEIVEKLNRLRQETGTTLYMVLLAVYALLLSKYTGQEDVTVGCAVAGRQHEDLRNLIGLFINALPLRNFPENTLTFLEFLERVKQNTLNAFDNQGYPFDFLLEKLDIDISLNRNPIFDVELILINMEQPILATKDFRLSPYAKSEWEATQMDLALYAKESEKQILFSMFYAVDLFKRSTIENFIEFFKEIISIIAENKSIPLHDIHLSYGLDETNKDFYADMESDLEF